MSYFVSDEGYLNTVKLATHVILGLIALVLFFGFWGIVEAEAEAIRIQAEAITSQGGAEYVQLQAIAKWNGTVPSTMVPGATVPFINLNR